MKRPSLLDLCSGLAASGAAVLNAYGENGWVVTTLYEGDDGVGFAPRLTIAPDGNPAICHYGLSSVHYTWFDGSEWHTSTVDDTLPFGLDPGWGCALIFDEADAPLITYYEGFQGGDLKFAWYDTAWHTTSIDGDETPDCPHPRMTSLPGNLPAIVYTDAGTDSSLRYAEFDGTTWTRTTIVDESGISFEGNIDIGVYPDVATTADESVVVSFYETGTETVLRVARRSGGNGGTWDLGTVEDLGPALPSGPAPVAGLPGGPFALAYVTTPAGGETAELKYATYDDGWTTVVIDEQAELSQPSLVLMPDGRPVILYQATPEGGCGVSLGACQLRLAWRDSAQWQIVEVTELAGSLVASDVAVLPDERLALVSSHNTGQTGRALTYAEYVMEDGTDNGGDAADSDDDGSPDDEDGCPNDPDKVDPGTCGCGTPDSDADNDGVADCVDDDATDGELPAAGACASTSALMLTASVLAVWYCRRRK